MRPVSTSSHYGDYNPRATIPKRGKGKRPAGHRNMPSKGVKRAAMFKNVNIFKYMGPDVPREFAKNEGNIVCTFFYELSPFVGGDEVLDGLVEMAKESVVAGYDLSMLTSVDIEFVKCSGKTCRVPRTVSDFEWSPEAVKSLAGQGDLYLRLCKDFAVSLIGQRGVQEGGATELHPVTSSAGSSAGISQSCSSFMSPLATNRVEADLMQEDFQPPTTPSSDEENELPPVCLTNTELLARERLYEIFENMAMSAIDEVLCLCSSDTTHAFKILINGPQVEDLLRLKRRLFWGANDSKKISIDDEEDLLEEALVYYKHPSFDPHVPVRIAFRYQPAIDTGGVTRQFFTDILCKFACRGVFQMFVGSAERLRPAYSPQVLPLMKIFGTVIGHSLLHEGPGFPYFAPFVYWYLATGCIQRALPYVAIVDDLSKNTTVIVQKVCIYLFLVCIISHVCFKDCEKYTVVYKCSGLLCDGE